jgi:hypothetical protein
MLLRGFTFEMWGGRMNKTLIATLAAGAVTALALAGCGGTTASTNTSQASSPTSQATAPSSNVPTDPGIKGCNAGTPPGYDQNQQVVFNGACDTVLGNESATIGGTSPADIHSWCNVYAGSSSGTDPMSKSMPACVAGVHAAMAQDGLS